MRDGPPASAGDGAGIRGEAARPRPPSRRLPWLLRVPLALVTIAALAYATARYVAPVFVQARLQDWLASASGRPVSIGTVEIDPLRPAIRIRALAVAREPAGRGPGVPVAERRGAKGASVAGQIAGPTTDGARAAPDPLLAIDDIRADLSWRSLIEFAPVLTRLQVIAPRVALARGADGRLDVEDLLRRAGDATLAAALPAIVGGAGGGSGGARFSFANIAIDDGLVRFDDALVGQQHRVDQVTVRIPFLSSLPVHQRIEVEPAFAARVNGAPVRADGQSQPFAPRRPSTLAVEFQAPDLTRYVGYLPQPLPVELRAARAAARLVVRFEQPVDEAPTMRASGALALAGVDLREPGGAPLLVVPGASVELRAIEPFARRYEFGRVVMSGPLLHLRRRPGETRFFDAVWRRLDAPDSATGEADGAAPAKAAEGAPAPSARGAATPADAHRGGARESVSAAATGGSGSPPLRWTLDEAIVEDGRLVVDDAARVGEPALRAVFAPVRMRVAGLGAPGEPPAGFEFTASQAGGQSLSALGSLSFAPLALAGRLSLRRLDLGFWSRLTAVPGAAVRVDARVDADGDFWADEGVRLAGWRARLADLRVSGAGEGEASLRVAEGELTGLALDARERRIDVDRVALAAGRLDAGGSGFGGLVAVVAAVTRAATANPDPGAARQSPPGAAATPAVEAAATGAAVPGSAPSDARTGWRLRVGALGARDIALARADGEGRGDFARIETFSLEGWRNEAGVAAPVSVAATLGSGGRVGARGSVIAAPLAGNLDIDAKALALAAMAPLWKDRLGKAEFSAGTLALEGALRFAAPADAARAPAAASARPGAAAADRGPPVLGADGAPRPDSWRLDWRGRATSEGGVLRAGGEEVFRWQRAEAGEVDLRVSPPRLAVGLLDVQAPIWRLALDADGKASAAALLAGIGIPELGAVRWRDGALTLTDARLQPPVQLALGEVEGELGAAAPGSPVPLRASARIAGGGSLAVDGQVAPLAETVAGSEASRPPLALRATLEAAGVALLDPYARRYLGHPLERGRLDAQATVRARSGQVEGETTLRLTGLTVGDRIAGAPADSPALRTALALLQPSDGALSLQVPFAGVAGELDEVIGRATRDAVSGALAKALADPFGALSALVGGADLSSVPFDAGSAALGRDALARLDALARALQARPVLRLEIVGHASSTLDRGAVALEQLRRMVKARYARRFAKPGKPVDVDAVDMHPNQYPTVLAEVFTAAQLPKPRARDGSVREPTRDEMEAALLATLPVGDSQLEELAERRAKAVRNWLLQRGRVDAGRLAMGRPVLDVARPAGAAARAVPAARVAFALR